MKKSEKYFGFSDCDDVMESFRVPADERIESKNILFACYGHEDYEGAAMVIFVKDGKLYEVNGSHCSCNGLEDQWYPEKTTWEAIKARQYVPFGADSKAADALLKLVERKLLKKRGKEPVPGTKVLKG